MKGEPAPVSLPPRLQAARFMAAGRVYGTGEPGVGTEWRKGVQEAGWRPSGAEIMAWVLILAAGLVISRGLFQPGVLLSGDNAVHQAEISALREIILPEQSWWSGWYEGDFAGYPLLVYQYPLGKWLVVCLGFLPGISLSNAYKLVLFLSWLFPVLVVVRILGRRGYTLLTLLTVSVFYLACFDGYLLSLAGMWNQYLSAGLFLIAVDSILKMLETGRVRQVALAAFWTSVAAVSHQFMLLLLPLVWVILVGIQARNSKFSSRGMYGLLILPVLSLLLSSWYFVPIFMTWDWPGFVVYPMDWYNLCSSLFPMVSSDLLRTDGVSACGNPLILLYSLGMVTAVVLGGSGLVRIFFLGWKGRTPDPLFMTSAGILLGVIVLVLVVLWEPFSFLRSFSLSVGGGRLALYLLLPLMILSAMILQPVSGKKPEGFRKKVLLSLPLLVLLPNLIWAAVSAEFPLPEILYLEGSGANRTEEMRSLDKIFTWLREDASPEEGRILYQDTAYNFQNHPLYWSHVLAGGRRETGLWGLGASGQLFVPTDPLTRTQGLSIFGKLRSEISPDELGYKMNLFNCRWALTCEPELETLFMNYDSVELVLQEGRFSLFRSMGKGAWAEIIKGQGTVRTIQQSDSRRILEADIESPGGAVVLVKSSYHPWWHVRLNGEGSIPEKGLPDQLLRIRIPAAGKFIVDLEFRPPRGLPVFLTLLGLLFAGLMIFWREGRL